MLNRYRKSAFSRLMAVLILAVLCLGGSATMDAYAVRAPSSTTPIKHIVIMMQENHPFDNYFGTFPGLQPGFAVDPQTCLPLDPSNPSLGCVHPWNADSVSKVVTTSDLPHSYASFVGDYDKGKMDGFVSRALLGGKNYTYPMAYYTNYTLPNYWNLAQYYALDANFFASAGDYSYPNHLYMVAGQAGNITNPKPRFDLSYAQIGTELTNAHVDWKYYSGAWNDIDNCQPYTNKTEFGLDHTDFSFYWGVLIDFPAIQQNPATCHNMLNLRDLMQNVSSGYLPQVSWVMPDRPHSEHPKSTGKRGLINGQEYTATVIDAISSNPLLWDNTVIFLAWDDWGGYYDHVAPNQVDKFGYGFRVPLIVISPYTSRGIYYGLNNQKQEDFTALLATIERNWNLPPLTSRDASQYSLFYMLNFSQPLLPPLILPTSSLSVYPFATCISRGLCSLGTNALVKYSFQQIPAGEFIPQGDDEDPND